MKLQFIDDWRHILRRAWTMRISIGLVFLGVVFTLMALVSDWMQKIVGPVVFAASFMVIGVTVGVARLLKQPGAEE